MSELSGRRVIVTGAAGNVGRAVCGRLASEGARVWAIDRESAAIADLSAALGPLVEGAPCDLADAAALEGALDAAGTPWGLVHTVGGWRGGGVATGSLADLDALYAMNLRTTFAVTSAVLRRQLAAGGGRLVTIGAFTAAAGAGLASAAAYNATKAAVIALTRAADEEGRGANVRANCLAPNTLDTPLNRASMPGSDPSTWVALSEVADAAVGCLRPSSGVGGAVLLLPGRA